MVGHAGTQRIQGRSRERGESPGRETGPAKTGMSSHARLTSVGGHAVAQMDEEVRRAEVVKLVAGPAHDQGERHAHSARSTTSTPK